MRRQTIITTSTCDLCGPDATEGDGTNEYVMGVYAKGVKGRCMWRRVDVCDEHASMLTEIVTALRGVDVVKESSREPVT